MGNSSRTKSFAASSAFKIGKGKNKLDQTNSLKKFENAINKKNAKQIARIVAPHLIGCMPDGSAKLPIYFGAKIVYD